MKEKIVAIVLGAGEGKRMGSGIPKQYMIINSRPLIYYALKAFEHSPVDEVILVTGEDEIEYCKKYIVDKYQFEKVSRIVAGGRERYESVYLGLRSIGEADYVLIHDGARPMLNADIIRKCIINVRRHKACVVGMPSKDTIKVVDNDTYAVSTPPRRKLWQVQTPQCFDFNLIYDAYQKLMDSGDTTATDDGMVLENYGDQRVKVKLIEGSYDNIKVTTPEDVRIAGSLVKARKLFRFLHNVHDKIIYLQMKILQKRFFTKKKK